MVAGPERSSPQERPTKFLSFEEARVYVQGLNKVDTSKAWWLWAKSGERPKNVPSNPNVFYKGQWKAWDDFLGKKPKNEINCEVADADIAYLQFEENTAKKTKLTAELDFKEAKKRYNDLQKQYRDATENLNSITAKRIKVEKMIVN